MGGTRLNLPLGKSFAATYHNTLGRDPMISLQL